MKGVEIKTPEQIVAMRRAGLVVQRAHEAVAAAARPGVTTRELDLVAREVLASAGATSSFLHYGAEWGMPPFPAVACLSVNEEIVHGIPGDRVLAEGDLLSFDVGAIVDGWHGDAAISVEIGQVSPEVHALNEATRRSMWAGIAAARVGGRLGDISAAIEDSIDAEPREYGIVAEYTGHGIGTAMHQPPDVPNLGRPGRGIKLVEGLALAIEPMITLGSEENVTLDDEWTVVTTDGSVACHWEHTIALTKGGVWVLTAADGGEAELAALGVPFGPLAD